LLANNMWYFLRLFMNSLFLAFLNIDIAFSIFP
jgi:hypothetical protein